MAQILHHYTLTKKGLQSPIVTALGELQPRVQILVPRLLADKHLVKRQLINSHRFPFFGVRGYSCDKDLRSKLLTAKILHHSILTKKRLQSPMVIAFGEFQPGV
jgi:hypothetical protein